MEWFFEKVRSHHLWLMENAPDSVASFLGAMSDGANEDGPISPPGLRLYVSEWERISRVIDALETSSPPKPSGIFSDRAPLGTNSHAPGAARAIDHDDLLYLLHTLDFVSADLLERDLDENPHRNGLCATDLVAEVNELREFSGAAWEEGYAVIVYGS